MSSHGNIRHVQRSHIDRAKWLAALVYTHVVNSTRHVEAMQAIATRKRTPKRTPKSHTPLGKHGGIHSLTGNMHQTTEP